MNEQRLPTGKLELTSDTRTTTLVGNDTSPKPPSHPYSTLISNSIDIDLQIKRGEKKISSKRQSHYFNPKIKLNTENLSFFLSSSLPLSFPLLHFSPSSSPFLSLFYNPSYRTGLQAAEIGKIQV
jgi:hypothetical protein